jgi:hypothetical protein
MTRSPLPAKSCSWRVSSRLTPVARKIPFDDPQTLTYVRIAYVAVQLIVLGTYYYMSSKVRLVILWSEEYFKD